MILSHARLPVPPQAHRCIIYQARPLPRLVRRSFPSRASYCASGLANCPLRAILRGSKIVLLYHYEPGFGPEARHRDYSFPLLRRLMKFLSQASDLSASTSGNHAPDGSVRFTLAEIGEGDHPLTTQHRFGGPLDSPPHLAVAQTTKLQRNIDGDIFGIIQNPKATVPVTGGFRVDAHSDLLGTHQGCSLCQNRFLLGAHK